MKAYEVMSVDVETATEDANVAEVATRIVLGGFNGMHMIETMVAWLFRLNNRILFLKV
jgi:hypothetical protein